MTEELIALLKSDATTLETVQSVLERVLFHAAEFFDDRDDDIAVAALLLARNAVRDFIDEDILDHLESLTFHMKYVVGMDPETRARLEAVRIIICE